MNEEKFWSLMDKNIENGCWNWTGAIGHWGYGNLKWDKDGKYKRAHKLAYELVIGPIPEGLVLDHLCRNRACCNPSHLEPVTMKENLHRGLQGNKTHCPHGHPYSPENTWIEKNGTRHCRECHRQNVVAKYHQLHPDAPYNPALSKALRTKYGEL